MFLCEVLVVIIIWCTSSNMQALSEANSNHTIAYGDDKWTYKAVDIIRDKINSSDINPLLYLMEQEQTL